MHQQCRSIIWLLAIIFCQMAHGQSDHLQEYNKLHSKWGASELFPNGEDFKQLLFHARHLHVDSVISLSNRALNDDVLSLDKSQLSIIYSYLSEAYTIRCLYPKATSFAEKAMANAAPGSEELALALRSLAFVTLRKPDAKQAKLYIDQSSSLFDSLSLPLEATRSRLLLQPMLQEDDAVLAADELLQGLDRAQKAGDLTLEKELLLHMGLLHVRMENLREGMRLANELEPFFDSTNHRYALTKTYFLKGWIGGKQDRPGSTEYMRAVARHFKQLANPYQQSLTHLYLSLSDFHRMHRRNRFTEIKRAKSIADSLGIHIPRLPLFQSWHYMGKRQSHIGIGLAKETYEMADQWGRKLHKFQATENLVDYYLATKKMDSAFTYHNHYRMARFAWHPAEKTMVSGKLEAKLAADKLLEEQRLVAEKEAALKDAELKGQKRTRNIFIAASQALLVILYLSWKAYRAQKRSRMIIEEQKLELEQMNRLNKEVFSVIAHDFKSPLVTMRIMAENLRNADLTKEDLDLYCADLYQQAGQTQLLLENLLNWARAELKVDFNRTSECRPSRICDEISQSLAQMAQEKEVEMVNSIPEEVSTPLHADVMRIVLRNLISNALKFSNRMQSVIIGFDKEIRAIYVADRGVGMTRDLQRQLFSQTVVSTPGTDFESGFGLGLYICHELLLKSDWNIEVESEEMLGTRFSFRPIVQASYHA